MSGRLEAAKLEVVAASETLMVVESLVVDATDDIVPADQGDVWLAATHDILDTALAAYVTIYNEESTP